MPIKKIKIGKIIFPSITGKNGALKFYKVTKEAYDQRILRNWDKVEAITTPMATKIGSKREDGIKVRINGLTFNTKTAAAKYFNQNLSTFVTRTKRGKLSTKKALETKRILKKSRTKLKILNDVINKLRIYAKKEKIININDWYSVKLDDIYNITQPYRKKIFKSKKTKITAFDFLCKYYPKKRLLPWLFTERMPEGTWDKKENRTNYIKWLLKKVKIRKNNLYKLEGSHFSKNNGSNLIYRRDKLRKRYSIIELLYETFPKLKLKFWFFNTVPDNIWSSRKYQLQYLEWFKKKKKITKPSDWYDIEIKDFKNLYSRSLTRYLKTVLKISKFCYPKYNFFFFFFKKIERGFFNSRTNILKYIHWLGNEVNIKKKKDWYIYGYENISNNGGNALLQKFSHSPLKILKYCYPNYAWKEESFGKTSKFERQLFKIVKKLLKNKKVIHRYKSKICRFKKSNRPMELDIYIPDSNIGIEFQGSQHYTAKWGKHELKNIKSRDDEKKKTFKRKGIKILEVTYKWKGQKEAIINLLEKNNIL